MSAVPWPTLDGPDADRAIRDATAAVWTWEEGASAESIVAALNERDVVLCDHTALAALRQRAIDAEALIDELQAERSHDDETRLVCLDWHLARHGLTADPKDGTR